jgi:hypothetical protein
VHQCFLMHTTFELLMEWVVFPCLCFALVLMTMVPSVCGGVLNHITGAKALVLTLPMGNSLKWVSLQKLDSDLCLCYCCCSDDEYMHTKGYYRENPW